MTRDEIFHEVARSMVDLFELEPSAVTPTARLAEDLDLDSIDAVDMAVKIQEMTGRRVDDASLRKVRTVGDVVDLVVQLSASKR